MMGNISSVKKPNNWRKTKSAKIYPLFYMKRINEFEL